MATYRRFPPQALGFGGNSPSGLTFALSAAGSWFAYGFTPAGPSARTLNSVRIQCTAVTGTLGSSDTSCDVYSDLSGAPNASLGSTTTVTGTQPVAASITEFTGLSVSLSPGTQYWIVLKNLNGTPASNFPTFRAIQNSFQLAPWATNNFNGWLTKRTTTSGASWTTTTTAMAGLRLGYSDSSFEGLPVTNVINGTNSAFGSSEVGVKFTSPSGVTQNVAGLAMFVNVVGSPTGNLRFRLYNNTTLLATTADILNQTLIAAGGSNYYFSYFTSVQVIQPGTLLRASITNSAADAAGNSYRCPAEYQIDNTVDSLALLPFAGTLQKSILSGGVWTDTTTSVLPVFLILDGAAGEFVVPSSSVIGRGVLNGGGM